MTVAGAGIDRFPLTPGSPEAVALHRLWGGAGTQTFTISSGGLVIPAATVAMHVLVRSDAQVAVQASLAWCNQFVTAVDPRASETHRVLTGVSVSAAPLSDRLDSLSVVSDSRYRGITVVATLAGQTAAVSFLTGNEHRGIDLGPMPLDIAVAGEQP